MSFWNNLPRPIMALAPLANVTDASFRRVIAKYSAHTRKDGTVGGPDVMWTEFVSADGLVKASPEGKMKLLADLMYTEAERPIVAQLFSANPEHMETASRLCKDLGFDGIDINMGCPDKTIEKQGAGAAMLKKPEVAVAVLRAAKRGAGNLPVSIKTRIGYHKNELETWLPALLLEHPAVITVHARTRKELSKVPARWEHVREAVELRNQIQNKAWQDAHPGEHPTLILGNGDALSLHDAEAKVAETGADGVMFGRAVFGNPWFFNPAKRLPERITASEASSLAHRTMSLLQRLYTVRTKVLTVLRKFPKLSHTSLHDSPLPGSPSQADAFNEADNIEIITLEERFRVMLEHTRLFEELLPFKNFALMKKHYKAYVNGFDGAKELRAELMEKKNNAEIEEVIRIFLATI